MDSHGDPDRTCDAARRDADGTAPLWAGRIGLVAWPGYLWFGLAVYLFLILVVLEPVRLALAALAIKAQAAGAA